MFWAFFEWKKVGVKPPWNAHSGVVWLQLFWTCGRAQNPIKRGVLSIFWVEKSWSKTTLECAFQGGITPTFRSGARPKKPTKYGSRGHLGVEKSWSQADVLFQGCLTPTFWIRPNPTPPRFRNSRSSLPHLTLPYLTYLTLLTLLTWLTWLTLLTLPYLYLPVLTLP